MRRFQLVRSEDVSGVSGCGIVAEGTLFSNGLVAVAWMGPHPSVNTHLTVKSVEDIHGHGGKTKVVWLD